MQDYPPGSSSAENKPHRSLFERLSALISPEPENRAELLALLLNEEVLAVSQDAGRVQGVRVSAANASGTECWARPLS